MPERMIKIPGPDHPISISQSTDHVIITVSGKVITDTTESLMLQEADYPVVRYIPRKDVDMTELRRSETRSYCPYKGDASYFSIPLGGERSIDAIWTYETPYDAAARIKDYLAFYSDRVDRIDVTG